MTWSLSKEQREETVRRVTANLFCLAFTKGLPITDDVALDAASTFERRAYTAGRAIASSFLELPLEVAVSMRLPWPSCACTSTCQSQMMHDC